MSQDIYLAHLKDEEFHMDRSIYVVASEQELHFKQLFRILEMLGFKQSSKCHHLSYGLVNLPSGRMKSREGTVVEADQLLEEVTKLASQQTAQRHPSIKTANLMRRSRVIAWER